MSPKRLQQPGEFCPPICREWWSTKGHTAQCGKFIESIPFVSMVLYKVSLCFQSQLCSWPAVWPRASYLKEPRDPVCETEMLIEASPSCVVMRTVLFVLISRKYMNTSKSLFSKSWLFPRCMRGRIMSATHFFKILIWLMTVKKKKPITRDFSANALWPRLRQLLQ